MANIIHVAIYDKNLDILQQYYNLKDVSFYAKQIVKKEINTFIKNMLNSNEISNKKLYNIVLDESIKIKSEMVGFIYCCSPYIYSIILNNKYSTLRVCTFLETLVTNHANFYKLIAELEEDKLLTLSEDLNNTKEVIFKATVNLLNRGDKIDCLVLKADNLGLISRSFKDDTAKLNRCCTIL